MIEKIRLMQVFNLTELLVNTIGQCLYCLLSSQESNDRMNEFALANCYKPKRSKRGVYNALYTALKEKIIQCFIISPQILIGRLFISLASRLNGYMYSNGKSHNVALFILMANHFVLR